MSQKFECINVGVIDDPDLGKGAVEIIISEKCAKPKIIKLILTMSHLERRIKTQQADTLMKNKEMEFLLADDI